MNACPAEIRIDPAMTSVELPGRQATRYLTSSCPSWNALTEEALLYHCQSDDWWMIALLKAQQEEDDSKKEWPREVSNKR